MGPSDRPLRGHRTPSLIFLGFAQTQNSLREFLVPQFNRIEVLASRTHVGPQVLMPEGFGLQVQIGDNICKRSLVPRVTLT